MSLIVVLFNPVLPIEFGRGAWAIIDIAVAILFLKWAKQIEFTDDGCQSEIVKKGGQPMVPSQQAGQTSLQGWMERFQVWMETGYIAGPNSSITTIFVRPKWEAIKDKILGPREGWKGLPDRLCWEWRYRHFSDLVSGMSFNQAEYSYYEAVYSSAGDRLLFPIGIDSRSPSGDWTRAMGFQPTGIVRGVDASIMGFAMEASKPGGKFPFLEGRVWKKSAQYGASHVLMIGCGDGNKYGRAPEEFGWAETTLGVFMLDDVVAELEQMDKIAIGASLRSPLRTTDFGVPSLHLADTTKTTDELESLRARATLQYIPKFNPRPAFESLAGFHIFENEFLIVGIQHHAFRGIFTTIPDYPQYAVDDIGGKISGEFAAKYYGKALEISEITAARKLLRSLYEDVGISIPHRWDNQWTQRKEWTEEHKNAVQRLIKEWPEKHKSATQKLKVFDDFAQRTPIRLLYDALYDKTINERVDQLSICWHLYDLYEGLESYEEGVSVGGYQILPVSKIAADAKQIRIGHPRGDIIIKMFDIKGGQGYTMTGWPRHRIILEMEGGPVFTALYYEGAPPSLGDEKGRGIIEECAAGKWPLLFLLAYFEILLSLTQHQWALNNSGVKTTG